MILSTTTKFKDDRTFYPFTFIFPMSASDLPQRWGYGDDEVGVKCRTGSKWREVAVGVSGGEGGGGGG